MLIKRAAIISIGVGIGPLFQLIATPWLSRIYTPIEFGYFALFVSSLSILSAIACLRYETAIPVVEDELLKPVVTIALLSVLATMIMAMLIFFSGIMQCLYPLFNGLGYHILWIPIAAACSGTMMLVYYLTLRRGEFVLNSVMRSLQPIIFLLLAIFFSGYGLLSAQIVSWLFVVILGFFYLRKDIFPIKRKALWETAIRFRQYPMLLTPTSLLDIVALTLPLLLIASAYGVEAMGNYSQIQRVIGAPLLLGSAALGQIFFKYSGELYRAGMSSSRFLWQIITVLIGVGLLIIFALTLVGEPVCKWLLGDNWRVDKFFLLLVTVPVLCRAIVSPVSTVFLTHHRVSLGVRWQFAYFLTTCVVLLTASELLNFEYFLLIYGMHEMIMYTLYLAMANRVATSSVM